MVHWLEDMDMFNGNIPELMPSEYTSSVPFSVYENVRLGPRLVVDNTEKPIIYLMGSMKNERIPEVAKSLREAGYDPFWEWMHSGPESDDHWQAYARDWGYSYVEALRSPHALNVFEFDKSWLHKAAAGVLVAPAGRSAHIELGYLVGRGTPAYILLDGEPDRFDIMPNFCYETGGAVVETVEELVKNLNAKQFS